MPSTSRRQVGGCGEVGAVAGFGGFAGEPDGEVRLSQASAAVDEEALARDVLRIVGAERDDDRGDVRRIHCVEAVLGWRERSERSLRHARARHRRDRIRAHTVAAELETASEQQPTLDALVISVGGPGSMVGFDFARTFNPSATLGTAQGMVNMGGFIASLLVMQAMGVILGALGGYSFESFRVAWTVQYAIWILAVVGILITRKKTRKLIKAEQERSLLETFEAG